MWSATSRESQIASFKSWGPLNHWYPSTSLHNITTQNKRWIFIAV